MALLPPNVGSVAQTTQRQARKSHDSRLALRKQLRGIIEQLEPRLQLTGAAGQHALEVFNTSQTLFIENTGQWADDAIHFAHNGNGANVAATDEGLRFQLFRPQQNPAAGMSGSVAAETFGSTAGTTFIGPQPRFQSQFSHETGGVGESSVGGVLTDPIVSSRSGLAGANVRDHEDRVFEFSASYVGANAVRPVGVTPSLSYVNYYVGDQTAWRSQVPAYDTIIYKSLYDGINMQASGNESSLKYEFHVAPGADWSQIQVRYDGIAGLSLNDDGSLHVDLGEEWGTMVDDAPFVYQEIDGERIEIVSQFVLLSEHTYSFLVGAYDPAVELVVDPDLSWSTYLDRGEATGIAVDLHGNMLASGSKWDPVSEDSDSYVVKLAPTGEHLWTTYFGGNQVDYALGIATDIDGNALVTGSTRSEGWANGGYDTTSRVEDGFVVKLNPAGIHLWSTYIGGDSGDSANDVAVDAVGNVFVTGGTWSRGWVTGGYDVTQGGQDDAFVVKLSLTGAHLWSTYLGGIESDHGEGIAVDAQGNAVLTGATSSANWISGGFDTTFNCTGTAADYWQCSDVFVAKLSPTGTRMWSTYLGGTSDYDPGETGMGVSLGGDGGIYITGTTTTDGWVAGGYDVSLAGNGDTDAFVAKLSGTGTALWSTYIGGVFSEQGIAVAVDNQSNAFVTGVTQSPGWVSEGADTTLSFTDAFVVKLDPVGEHIWSSYLGGSATEVAHDVVIDNSGIARVVGGTSSPGWIVGGYDTTSSGFQDGFVAVINENPPFEMLARGVAYQDWTRNQSVIVDTTDLGYMIDEIFCDATSGFYAVGLESLIHGPALVIRGTQELIDWWSNSDPRGVGYDQFERNWTTAANCPSGSQSLHSWFQDLAFEGRAADIVGHSLGGALAQLIASELTFHGTQIDNLVTFNSPGINNVYATNFDSSNAISVTHYLVNGDVVSMAGERYLPGIVRIADFRDSAVWEFNKHSLPLTVPRVGDKHRRADLTWDDSWTASSLSSPLFEFTDPDYERFLLGMQVVLNGLAGAAPITSPLRLIPAMLKFRGTTELGRQGIGIAARALSDALRAAKDAYAWVEMEAGEFALSISERVGDIYEATKITIESVSGISVESIDPKMIRFEGGLGIKLGEDVNIQLPDWLGGPIISEHLIELVGLDYGGEIDRHHIEVNGQVRLLGDLVTLGGQAELDWKRGDYGFAGSINIGAGFITGETAFNVAGNLNVVARGNAAISIPAGVPLLGGKEIAVGEYLLNYVADSDDSNDFVAAWGSIAGRTLGLRVWFDGRLPGLMGAQEIMVLSQRGPVAAPSAAQRYVIEPGTDWAMFFVEWENATLSSALTLRSPSGQLLDETAINADPSMAIVWELSTDNRRVVRVDSPVGGIWEVAVADDTGLGTINISTFVSDPVPSIAAVDASGGLFRQPVGISVEAFDASSQGTIALFYDRDGEGFDGIMIADGLAEVDGITSYMWSTTGVAAGTYRVYARIMDDVNVSVMRYAEHPIVISDPPRSFRREDVALVAMNLGTSFGATEFDGDFTGDGRVDLVDLALVQQNYDAPAAAPGAVVAQRADARAADAAIALYQGKRPALRARRRAVLLSSDQGNEHQTSIRNEPSTANISIHFAHRQVGRALISVGVASSYFVYPVRTGR